MYYLLLQTTFPRAPDIVAVGIIFHALVSNAVLGQDF